MSASTLAARTATLSRRVAVGGQALAGRAGDRVALAAERRARQLRDDGERGAQAAEYAMLGGVGAAACGTIVIVIESQGQGWIGELLGAAFNFAQGLFG